MPANFNAAGVLGETGQSPRRGVSILGTLTGALIANQEEPKNNLDTALRSHAARHEAIADECERRFQAAMRSDRRFGKGE
jgi:hypothetical protein